MTTPNRHTRFTAQHAARIALGAFYNAARRPSLDGPALLGAWMEEVSHKLREDDITRRHYGEIIRRWEVADNAVSAGQNGNGLPPGENAPDNADPTGAENG